MFLEKECGLADTNPVTMMQDILVSGRKFGIVDVTLVFLARGERDEMEVAFALLTNHIDDEMGTTHPVRRIIHLNGGCRGTGATADHVLAHLELEGGTS